MIETLISAVLLMVLAAVLGPLPWTFFLWYGVGSLVAGLFLRRRTR